MKADEVIAQIKALDPEERAKVLDLLKEIEAAEKIAPMDDQRFDQAAHRVMDRHAALLRKLAR
jgi:flagellar motility protein MotE (MotC chaperone)